MSKMKELFMEQREAEAMRSQHMDDDYHYDKWKKEQEEAARFKRSEKKENDGTYAEDEK